MLKASDRNFPLGFPIRLGGFTIDHTVNAFEAARESCLQMIAFKDQITDFKGDSVGMLIDGRIAVGPKGIVVSSIAACEEESYESFHYEKLPYFRTSAEDASSSSLEVLA